MESTNIIKGETWGELGFSTRKSNGKEYTTCPTCSPTRKKKHVKCAIINHEKGWANCYHCQAIYKLGSTKNEYNPNDFLPAKGERVYEKPQHAPLPSEELQEKVFAKIVEERGISLETLNYAGVTVTKEFIPACNAVVPCIAFPYYRFGELINVKYRAKTKDGNKTFKLVSKAELLFYNEDALYQNNEVIIVEGEYDLLTYFEAGIYNVVSVPNGAGKNPNLQYLDTVIGAFDSIDRVIISVDKDTAGEFLAEELIRRLGREKCYKVQYPEGCKDANEVLKAFGKDGVKKLYNSATDLPIEGIYTAYELLQEVLALYNDGYPKVHESGLKNFDEYFKLVPGELTIITGAPGSGKSTFWNELIQRYAYFHGLKAGVLSWEQQPIRFYFNNALTRMYNKRVLEANEWQKPYNMERMTVKEIHEGMAYLSSYFQYFKCHGTHYTIKEICLKMKELVRKFGINIMCIDPFTHISKADKGTAAVTDTDYIGEALVRLNETSKELNVHTFLIAHPTKNLSKPFSYVDEFGDKQTTYFASKYDVSGSANFLNVTDNFLSIGRHPVTAEVLIFIEKIRNQQFAGKLGSTQVVYTPHNGRYMDYPHDIPMNYFQHPSLNILTKTDIDNGYTANCPF